MCHSESISSSFCIPRAFHPLRQATRSVHMPLHRLLQFGMCPLRSLRLVVLPSTPLRIRQALV
jgi:hypothetical protein